MLSFFNKNIYLLILAAWLVTLAVIIDNYWSSNSSLTSVQRKVTSNIQERERDFAQLVKDSSFREKIISNNYPEEFLDKLLLKDYFVFFYTPDSTGQYKLQCWNTNLVFPSAWLLFMEGHSGMAAMNNGYYVWNSFSAKGFKAIALIPMKWNYAIPQGDKYLENGFADQSISSDYGLTKAKVGTLPIESIYGNYLISVDQKSFSRVYNNNVASVCLLLLAAMIFLYFIHLCASYIVSRYGLWQGALFFILTVGTLRVLSYYYPIPLNFRQFELFDPAIYGSSTTLRSLGDLFINSLIFVWGVFFIRHHVQEKRIRLRIQSKWGGWILLGIGCLILLLTTFSGNYIVRSLVADSKISFDVVNFFTLSYFSVIGFIILCCLAIAYYFLCQVILYLLRPFFSGKYVPLFLGVAIGGLIMLSFRVGSSGWLNDLFVLGWLLLFLFLLNNAFLNLLASRIVSSKLVFWLFFFSLSITTVIIRENDAKEQANRRHYAEIIATKADPSNEALLNSRITDFRQEFLADNFHRFNDSVTNQSLKDSLVNLNQEILTSYTRKYETRIVTFTADKKPLYNLDAPDFNTLNTIIGNQGKATSKAGLYFYDEGYDKFRYISKIDVKNWDGTLMGYMFIILTPKKFSSESFSPELFGRGESNAIENSSIYAFAVYKNWKLVDSHNDYSFATDIEKPSTTPPEFKIKPNKNYTELWHYAGANTMIVIARENTVSIESITLFSYLFCSFLFLTALFWVFNILVKSGFSLAKMKGFGDFSIRNQIHGTIILVSVLSFVVIGIATILFFINRYERNNRELLSKTIHIMENEVKSSLKSGWRITDSTQVRDLSWEGMDPTNKKISEIYGTDMNLYDLEGRLQVSSLELPYKLGIISMIMEPKAYYHMHNKNEAQFFHKEKIGKLKFSSNYIPVTDENGEKYAYLNIPYFTSQAKLKDEISNFLVTIINLNAFIFLIAGIVALFITNRITSSFSLIANKMRKVNLSTRNEAIKWKRKDEIGALVNEYNKMVNKLDESARALAQTEREGAWREMARQIAHEIKNPLTPMKLSIQYLQRSIESHEPNVQELTADVSNTLVEQIDHLSQIANEFSQFANIEQAKNEIFDMNDVLKTVLHLYSTNDKLKISTRLIDQQIMIDADKTHINRLFTNLLQNALQAVDENRDPELIVEEEIIDGKIVVKVTDNGLGITEEVQPYIFTPNFTTKTSGTGLGLAMCKRMVEQAHGKIWFETIPGEGTTFIVEFPLVND